MLSLLIVIFQVADKWMVDMLGAGVVRLKVVTV
jgi:hypothetical protein